jgi:hypothetical protein
MSCGSRGVAIRDRGRAPARTGRELEALTSSKLRLNLNSFFVPNER